jgi:hypothetical protein
MNCNCCHSPILEDARRIDGQLSVHYWCLDFLESGAAAPGGQTLSRSLIEFVLSMAGAYLRRLVPQLQRRSQSA